MNPQGVSTNNAKTAWLTRDAGVPFQQSVLTTKGAIGNNSKRSSSAKSTSSSQKNNNAASSSSANTKDAADGFSSFGLDPQLVDTLHDTLHFTHPTPIQRKSIPLLMQGADVVAMARTGSGKTAAFCLPMIQRLREHATMVGMRSVIFSPTRELAIQTLRHFRMLAKHTNLRSTAITGGDGLNAQFESLAENPDVVVSSPGRLLHIIEEVHQNLLARVQVCILDEADRLFELGFQAQIHALMKKIPERAQRCLFSATMPSILAEFTEAGLHNPIVVRLDSEMKLSSSLKHSTFVVRTDEKPGALVYLLMQLIGVPSNISMTNAATAEVLPKRLNPVAAARNKFQKKKSKDDGKDDSSSANGGNHNDKTDYNDDDETYQQQQTDAGRGVPAGFNSDKQVLVFVESRYHVEFLGDVLPQCYGVKTVAIHGNMDQEARKENIQTFRRKDANVLVVTDVAARGIDLPALDYVVNFSFPHEPKLFVHRVGRVARAGRTGTAYSIITSDDMPYYFDCMQFIGRTPHCRRPSSTNNGGQDGGSAAAAASSSSEKNQKNDDMLSGFTPDDGCYGRIPTHALQAEVDTLNKLVAESIDLKNLWETTQRAHGKYTRTKKRATTGAMRAAHEQEDLRYENIPVHPMLDDKLTDDMKSHHAALNDLRKFKAKETLLDIIHGGKQFDLTKTKTGAAKQQQEQQQQLQRQNGDTSGETKTGAAMLKQLTNEILGAANGDDQQQQGGGGGKKMKDLAELRKLSLADKMSKRAEESRRRARAPSGGARSSGVGDDDDNDDDGGSAPPELGTRSIDGGLVMSVRSMFGDQNQQNNSTDLQRKKQIRDKKDLHRSHNSLVVDSAAEGAGDFRDREYFLESEKQETIDSAHLSLKGHAMDFGAESADDAKNLRSVYAWNKNKNRYVKTNVNDAKAMLKGIKNEAGKKVDFKAKLDAYKGWTKSTNMRIQDIGEEEDLTALRTARNAIKTGDAEQAAFKAGFGSDMDAAQNNNVFNTNKNDDDDIDPALLDDPVHARKARIGRKMKRLPAQGRVKTFEQMSLEKRRKAKDVAKLEARRARKAGKKRS